jgi:hypothetical protein
MQHRFFTRYFLNAANISPDSTGTASSGYIRVNKKYYFTVIRDIKQMGWLLHSCMSDEWKRGLLAAGAGEDQHGPDGKIPLREDSE